MGLCAEIQNLSVSFHGRKAVSGINAALPSDGITVLIGRSGSGKTTFLRALNRLNETFEGYEGSGSIRLLLGGEMKDICSSGTLNLTELRRKVGMVFQTPNPLPLSIRRNIMRRWNSCWDPGDQRLTKKWKRHSRQQGYGMKSETGLIRLQTDCPVGSSKDSVLRGLLPLNRRCCFLMNPQLLWTRGLLSRSRTICCSLKTDIPSLWYLTA